MTVIAVKTVDLTQNFKEIADKIFKDGERVLVARPRNENLVILAEAEYNKLEKISRNAEYHDMLEQSRKELAEGRTVVFGSVDELIEMENMNMGQAQSYVNEKAANKGTNQ